MDVTKIKILYELQYEHTCSEAVLSYFQNQIEKYYYPIGAVLDIMFSTNYDNFTYNNHKTYFTDVINALYEKEYNNDERQIIIGYIASHYLPQFQWMDSSIPKDIYPLLSLSSDKEEVLSLQDELKYKYVVYLLRSNSPNREIIKRLIHELEESTAPEIIPNVIKLKENEES